MLRGPFQVMFFGREVECSVSNHSSRGRVSVTSQDIFLGRLNVSSQVMFVERFDDNLNCYSLRVRGLDHF